MVAQFLIPAAASLVGGLMGQSAADDNREAQQRMAAQNIAMQKEFAQQGVRWKVEDAKAAGVHPLYALGAQTHSFAPVSVGSSSSSPMGSALASMGQDVGRAIHATTTSPERANVFTAAAQQLQLDNMALQNQLLASRLATLNQGQSNPALPGGYPATETPIDPKLDPQNRVVMNNTEIRANPGWSPASTIQEQYGEWGENMYSIPKSLVDLWHHYVTTDPDAAANRAVQERHRRSRREGYPIGHRHWRE